jgi:hypothetical protein
MSDSEYTDSEYEIDDDDSHVFYEPEEQAVTKYYISIS